ncbi:RNA polymerase-binding protein RbpA [Catenulispora rubra]|uniref:RNA polymerase-binding protein RbpA n=1 Tax=Catenulispora rubra TaxID=280293 RepID=UPI001891F99A|nr:RNA polymerase-binding protein RbpA [Catenulispora rubra]
MAHGNAIRGTRVGAGPSGEDDRGGDGAERRRVDYFCSRGHRSRLIFAAEAEVPKFWDCPRCGLPAGLDEHSAPGANSYAAVPYRTHMAYVRERRSDEDGQALLDEALAKLRGTS